MAAASALSSQADAWPASVWRGDSLAQAGAQPAWPTGHAALDAVLPGGGWPAAGLVELLAASPGASRMPAAGGGAGLAEAVPWLSLLGPWLADRLAQRGPDVPEGPLVWVTQAGGHEVSRSTLDLQPLMPGLQARGLPAERLLWVQAERPADALWACEQALGCGSVPAVLAWLPAARAPQLRRLHLKALDAGCPLFVWRPWAQAHDASAAPLRLAVGWQAGAAASELALDRLAPDQGQGRRATFAEGAAAAFAEGAAAAFDGRWRIEVLKRRGPPLASPVSVPAWWQPRLELGLAAMLATKATTKVTAKVRTEMTAKAPPPWPRAAFAPDPRPWMQLPAVRPGAQLPPPAAAGMPRSRMQGPETHGPRMQLTDVVDRPRQAA